MSTALRIASVTQVLKDLLTLGATENDVSGFIGGSVTVTSLPPDKIEIEKDKEISQLNIFMYQVTYNQGWQNIAHPAFNSRGERIANPPLALDLHYLLSAYGSTQLQTDILLGLGMQIFHEKMILDKKTIRWMMDNSASLPGGATSLKLLSDSELVDQVEQITLTPEILSIEDISKLWAAFGAKYRPTSAYKVTVVLLESRKSTRPGLPVKERKIYVNPFKEPVIEAVASQLAVNSPVLKDQKILSGHRLVLLGKQLQNESVQILIDGKTADGIGGGLVVTDNEISIGLLPDVGAGSCQVQVAHPRLMGSPPVPHIGVVSRPATFVLSPRIVTFSPDPITLVDGLVKTAINLHVEPAINPGQEVVLQMDQVGGSPQPHSYSFVLPASALHSPPQPTKNIKIKITGVVKGDYLLRVVADGAESPLESDAQGNYTSPLISL